ncbi:cyclase family protein [Nocardia sp. R6R-6]|uniref:cyclase family protein n=1 Tax=Nocardia sp. R6R-6 TaxID=3459303 RepID=UPI00403D8F6E
MGRKAFGHYDPQWNPPGYTVDESGKVIGGYKPPGVSNWGRWGEHDQRGASQLIGEAETLRAARSVRRGAVFSLALPIDATAPRWPGRPPAKHYFAVSGSDVLAGSRFSEMFPGHVHLDDHLDMALQGSTQWDALAHIPVDDTFYNGYWVGTATSDGAPFDHIGHQRESFVGRGLLLDLARHEGVDSLEPGRAVGPDELDAVCAAEGIEVLPGDIVLIRTGYLSRWWSLSTDAEKLAYFMDGCPGPGAACAEWFARNDVAAVAADTVGFEVMPAQDSARPFALHRRLLCDLGVSIGELWSLDALAADCAEDGVYEFLLVAPPLYIPEAVGSPLNPIAIK